MLHLGFNLKVNKMSTVLYFGLILGVSLEDVAKIQNGHCTFSYDH